MVGKINRVICVLLLAMIFVLPFAYACGGRDVLLLDEMSDVIFSEKYSEMYGQSFSYDLEGNILIEKENIKVSKKDADTIVMDFLDLNNPGWESLAFETLDLEHGRAVYMYEAHAPGVAVTHHVGAVRFVTDHFHLHVDAINGDLLDVGCGGAPSKVLSKVSLDVSSDYEWDYILPNGETYFYTDFVIPEGDKPEIDGKIDKNEWADAKNKHFHLGSLENEIVSYGCGGSGKEIKNSFGVLYEVEIFSKIVGDNLYVAVKTKSPNWVGIMFKDFPHHGMIGDFGDVKILTQYSIEDYYLASDKNNDIAIKKTGIRGCFHYAKLIEDQENNLIESATSQGENYVYEFVMPLSNSDPADTHWEYGEAYQISVLLGTSPKFYGLTKDTYMSSQETVRLGEQLDYNFVTQNPKFENSDEHYHGHNDLAVVEKSPNLFERMFLKFFRS
jgi:hypothetical protein